MKNLTKFSVLALLGLATVGCSFHARSAKDYADVTQKVLASKNSEIRSCYETVLKQDKKAAGVVAVNFTVEAKTGAIIDPKVDEQNTTAPEPVSACVVDNMAGLKIDPPDQREGQASFAYNFKANQPKQL